MLPYQTYQLYQIERQKTAAEIRIADERAGRTAAALAGLLRNLMPALRRRSTAPCGYGRMMTTVEVR